MILDEIVQKLKDEIEEENRKEIVGSYEQQLSKKIDELSKNENFFNLPLKNIFSVISKVDFNLIEENDKIMEILQNIIKNTISKHFEEKETILILQTLNTKTISFCSYDEIISILELIRNCPILVNFCNLYKEQNKEVDIDYEYELQQKDKEIEKLKQKILKEFPPIIEKPVDFEQDINIACKKGKLSNVQWLIEKQNVNKNIPDFNGDTPIHYASKNGHLRIVQYLIERQNVDIDIKGFWGKTPLHCASQKGHLQIVEYLLSKGANIEAKDIFEKTPLHYCCEKEHLQIVEYLISKGANIEAKSHSGCTPLHFASSIRHADIFKYLISKGANKYALNKDGKRPYNYYL